MLNGAARVAETMHRLRAIAVGMPHTLELVFSEERGPNQKTFPRQVS